MGEQFVHLLKVTHFIVRWNEIKITFRWGFRNIITGEIYSAADDALYYFETNGRNKVSSVS